MSNICNRPVTPKHEKRKRVKENDDAFLEWLSYQPSCIDGSFNQYLNGVGRNIACHVRRINRSSGMGKKPPFSSVPMTQEQHDFQHLKGEMELLWKSGLIGSRDTWEARIWFNDRADKYLLMWRDMLK